MTTQNTNQVTEYLLSGTLSVFPDKKKLSEKAAKEEDVKIIVCCEELGSGEYAVNVFMKEIDTDGFEKARPVGFIDVDNLDFIARQELLSAFKDNEVRQFKVESIEKGKIFLSIVKDTEDIKKEEMQKDNYNALINSGVITKEELDARVEYMSTNGVPMNVQEKILSKIIAYPEHIALNIPHPEVLFVDKGQGILKNALALVAVGSNVIFEGLMGTGKNVLCESIAWILKRPLYRFSLNSQISNIDLLGGKTIEGDTESKELVFERSTVIEAFEEGGVLVLDEMNMAQPHILPVLNSLLDTARSIAVPGYKVVKGHIGFIALGTQNPGYIGTHAVNQAISNRFRKIKFKEPNDIISILQTVVEGIEDDFLELSARFYEKLREAVYDESLPVEALDVRGFISAAKLSLELDYSPREALSLCIVENTEDREYEEIVKNFLENA